LRDAGVSLYAAHAALDCLPELGNSDALAALLGVRVEGRLVRFGGGGYAGAYGSADGTFEAFVERVREVLGAPVESWRNNDAFGRVAIVTGAGLWTGMLEEARSLGCDTYLTGEVAMYTKLYARETGLNLIAGTHYATESFGVQRVSERAAAHFGIGWTFVREGPDIL
jgi:putative NIF3 family GTP cyclohydrolase 1 type 2